jgi:sorting nexin-1/2
MLLHSRPPRRPSPEDDAVGYITVSDPVIHADGMNKYTSYRVECRPPTQTNSNPNDNSSIPDPSQLFHHNFNNHPFSSVLRRYSDFLWLYDSLHTERPGAIVPPLPDKQAVSRFSPEFVEDRRVGLEKFLRRVVCHPELGDAACLMTFLRADDLEFQHVKKTTTNKAMDFSESSGIGSGGVDNNSLGGAGAFHLNPQKNTATLKKWFSEAKTTLSNDLVSSPDDDLFEEIERYIEVLSMQMKRVSNQASSLVRKSREIANGMFEFSLAFHQLAQSEGGNLGRKLQQMGTSADSLSSLAVQQSDLECRSLEEPFKDYLKIIHGVKMALTRRHEKRVSYTALLQEIQGREMSLHRLRMTPGCEAKAYSSEMSLQRYHTLAQVAKEEYAECSQRVLREVDRFKREKAEEMRGVVLEFILLEIEVNRGMERVWADLIPKLEEKEGEESGSQDEGGAGGGSMKEDGAKGPGCGDGEPRNQQQQQLQQHIMTMVTNMPPPPSVSTSPYRTTATMMSSSPLNQPMQYSNVPSSSAVAGAGNSNTTTLLVDCPTMMESSIQYRDISSSEMGL